MGRVGIATNPTRTMTMAMTIANTGRSMKNFAIYLPAFTDLGIHDEAGSDLLYAFDNDAVAGFQPLRHDHALVVVVARNDAARQNLIIRTDGEHRLQALQVLNGALRDQDHIFLFRGGNANASELAGENGVPRIREGGL